MELDDLRRQWRQPEPAASALTSSQLAALLKSRTGGLIEKMRRNAWLEFSFTMLIAVLLLLAVPRVHNILFRLYTVLAQVVAIIGLFFYYRLLSVLRRMNEPSSSVRGHLATLAQGMRHLLRFYYRLTLASGPVTMVLVLGIILWQLYASGKPVPWQVPAVVSGIWLVFGAIAQVGIVYLTRWWVQRVYGQHLDRLEGQLRELDEPLAPAAP